MQEAGWKPSPRSHQGHGQLSREQSRGLGQLPSGPCRAVPGPLPPGKERPLGKGQSQGRWKEGCCAPRRVKGRELGQRAALRRGRGEGK